MSSTFHKPTEFHEVVESFGGLLALRDEDSIRIAIAAYIANKFSTDPVWVFIIAASSSGKSEFINALAGLEGATTMSSLTPTTFLSGFQAKNDPSLLANIKEDAVFLLKDFTTILSLRQDDRAIIMSQLREIYDGKIEKNFGNGVIRSWKGKVGFIAGCTYSIEDAIMMNATYGDRFLYWKMSDVDTDAAMDKQLSVVGREKELRDAMRDTLAGFVASLGDLKLVPLPDKTKRSLRELCKFAVLGRGPVEWNPYTKDIVSIGRAESPMRSFKQILALATGLAIIRGGEWDEQDWRLITKIALDAVPSSRMRTVRFLQTRRDAWLSTKDVGLGLRINTNTARRYLNELEVHGLVDRMEETDALLHRLSDSAVKMLSYEDTPDPEPVVRESL
jgi:hypothetical protein